MSSRQRIEIAVAIAAIVAVVIVAIAAVPGDAAGRGKARSCDDVVVQFEPEGSGGGTEIKAKGLKCKKARKVIRKCINGKLASGWSGKYADPKFVLSKGDRRIRYLPVGGGGCIPV